MGWRLPLSSLSVASVAVVHNDFSVEFLWFTRFILVFTAFIPDYLLVDLIQWLLNFLCFSVLLASCSWLLGSSISPFLRCFIHISCVDSRLPKKKPTPIPNFSFSWKGSLRYQDVPHLPWARLSSFLWPSKTLPWARLQIFRVYIISLNPRCSHTQALVVLSPLQLLWCLLYAPFFGT